MVIDHAPERDAPRGRARRRRGRQARVGREAGRPRRSRTPIAVAEAARDAGVVNAVGFCYRFAPAVAARPRADRARARSARSTTTAASSSPTTPTAPDAAASWRFLRADAGSGALGDLMAHIVDMTHFLVGPIERLSGRTATMIPRRPRLPIGEGTHFSRVATDDLVEVENEDWAGALIELERRHGRLAGGQPRDRRPARAHALRGARHRGRAGLGARAHERAASASSSPTTARDEGYMTVLAGRAASRLRGLPARRRACRWATTTCACSRRRTSWQAIRDGEQRGPGLEEMRATAHVLDAIERSAGSGGWEPAR